MPGRHGHATPRASLKQTSPSGEDSHAHSRAAFAATLLCVLAICALLTGCGATAAARTTTLPPVSTPFPTDTPTVQPVTTPAVKAPLSWHISTLPDGATLFFPVSILTVAPSNGDVAYLCDGSQRPSARFYATHDHGAHWQRMTDIPTGTSCTYPVVDAADANTLLFSSSLFTTDGGVTWQQRTSASQPPAILALATWHSLRYAIADVSDTNGTHTMLAVSTDTMRSWRYTDPQTIAPHLTSSELNRFQLWVNPSSGTVLANIRGRLWQSTDSGQHWSPLPGQQFPGNAVAVQPPQAGQPWRVCLQFSSYGDYIPFSCTTDGGRTWRDLPLPAENISLANIAADGSLLVTGVWTTVSVYRLPLGTNQWQALGDIPSLCGMVGSATFAPSSSGGSWWALPPGGKGACNQFATAPANRS